METLELIKEEWRFIDEGLTQPYEISNLGRLRNGEHIMKGFLVNSGYWCFSLTGKYKKLYAHRLVVKYFIGDFDAIFDRVNHIDGNKLNNRVDNLERSNNSLNMKHKHRVLGFKVHNIALTKAVAEEIRELYRVGNTSQAKLGKQFNVSTMLINRIINFVQYEYR